MIDGSTAAPGSPFARAAKELSALGYHTLPIVPGDKAPGEYKRGVWARMFGWEKFRDRAPTEFERGLWARSWPDAGIGIVLGSPAGSERLIAVDVDAEDVDQFEAIISAIPYSPMVKRGKKGETRFYRAPPKVQNKAYNIAGARVVDLLTGSGAKQTVCPPSVHPSGVVYSWLSGPVAPHDLPVFGEDELERLEDTLAHMGWNAALDREKRAAPEPDAEEDLWGETKRLALANLDAWVPHLDLYGLTKARGGYAAVETWRPSSTGKALHERKTNLSIQPSGIKDFGSSNTYSAIDLVMLVRQCSQEHATDWLRDRLGIVTAPVFIPPAPKEAEVERPEVGELPVALTRVPGLVGELTDWIANTSRRPQRGLALGAALTLVGTAAGRKYAGPTRTGTHLYVLGLARTSAGKDHALQQISRILSASGMAAHIGPAQFMSMQAVVKRLTRTPLCLCAMDEFGAFIARINSKRGNVYEQAITGVLRTAWGSSFQTMAPPEWAGQDSEPIHSPALSIYGVSTPEELYDALQGGDVHNGFLNRFLLFSTRVRPREQDPKADPFLVPDSVRAAMQRIYGSTSVQPHASSNITHASAPLISATWDNDAAKAVYVEFGRYVEDREQEAAFLARTVEMAQRLATIRAIGVRHDAPRITVADMEWGRDVALWSAERMIVDTSDYLADTQNQADAQRIVRILKESGEMPHQGLMHAMKHRVKARDLKDLITGLEEAGQIIVRVGDAPAGGGVRPKFYRIR